MTNKLILNRPGCGSKKTRDIKTSPKGSPDPRCHHMAGKSGFSSWMFANPAINLHFSPCFTIFLHVLPFFTCFLHFSQFFSIFHHFSGHQIHHFSRGKHHPSDKNGLCGAHRPGARIAAVLLEVVGLGAMPGFGDPRMGEVMVIFMRDWWMGIFMVIFMRDWWMGIFMVISWWFSWGIDGWGFSWWFHGDFHEGLMDGDFHGDFMVIFMVIFMRDWWMGIYGDFMVISWGIDGWWFMVISWWCHGDFHGGLMDGDFHGDFMVIFMRDWWMGIYGDFMGDWWMVIYGDFMVIFMRDWWSGIFMVISWWFSWGIDGWGFMVISWWFHGGLMDGDLWWFHGDFM